MAQPIRQFYTPEHYLALEDVAAYKHEYYNGEIFAMAGATVDHARIVNNFSRALAETFEDSSCEAFANDIKLQSATKDYYTYPDIVIVCGELQYAEERDDTLTNPAAIIEILSPSTRKYDQGDKFPLYKEFETLQCYVLVDSKKINIEVRQKQADGVWTSQTYQNMNDILKLPTLDFETPIANIYRRVEFKKQPRHPRVKKPEVNQNGSTN